MILACLCGGVIEFIILAIISFVAPIVSVWRLNRNQAKKVTSHKVDTCPCDCHDVVLRVLP